MASAPVPHLRARKDGLRERKKQRTRELLEDAALELFAERDFADVTVDEIAERAEVSRSTFFRYFPTKEDVLAGRTDALLEELRDEFVSRPDDEPVVRSLRSALLALAGGYEDRRGEFLVIRDVAIHHPEIRARHLERQAAWEEAFADLLAVRLTGGRAAHRRARIVMGAVMAATRVAVDEWIDGDGRSDLRALLGEAFDVLGDGLGAALADDDA